MRIGTCTWENWAKTFLLAEIFNYTVHDVIVHVCTHAWYQENCCFAAEKFCYRDEVIGIPLPLCQTGYWYNCIIQEFTPGQGNKLQVCDMGILPGWCAIC